MAIGDITSIIETVEYDTSNGTHTTVLKLSDGVVAIWYTGAGADGIVKTYPINPLGDIGTMIDSWTFESGSCYGSGDHPSVIEIADNIFAVAYRAYLSDPYRFVLYFMTMTISTAGTITKSAIDECEGPACPSSLEGFIRKTDTTKYVVFWDEGGGAPDGHMATFTIDNNGTNIALVDTWEFDTTKGGQPKIIHVAGDIFAITYNDGTNGVLKTFEVSDAGSITKSWLDTETFRVETSYYHYIVNVSGSVFAVFSCGTTRVYTFNISSTGVIVAIDSGAYFGPALLQISPYKFKTSRGDVYFLVTGRSGSWIGYAGTLSISTAGAVGALIDLQVIESGDYQYGYIPVEIQPGIFLLPWSDTPGADGWISTVGLSAPNLYPSDTITRVTGIRHIYKPGLFRMLLSFGDVSNTIEIAEHKVRKELEIPERQTPAPVVSKCEEGATSGAGTNKYTCIGGVWAHTPEAPTAAPAPPTEIPSYPSYWGGGPVSQLPGIQEYLERQRQEEELPKPLAERMPPAGELVKRVWEAVTPWKEEAGETFGGEIAERVKSFTGWIRERFK